MGVLDEWSFQTLLFGCYQRSSVFISGLFFEPLIPELDQWFLLEPLIDTYER